MTDARDGDETIPPGKETPAIKQWLMRFADPIVLVALIAALASASFAYQTNRISQRQVELLNRQVSIEESLALPVFTVTLGHDGRNGGSASNHWLSIDNSGGLANDLVIDVLPFISFWWYEADAEGERTMMQGDELPLVGYFDEYNYALPSRMVPGSALRLGFPGNAAGLSDVVTRLADTVAGYDSVTELDYSLEVAVVLSYVDYSGIQRHDFYIGTIGSDGEVFPPHQMMRLDSTYGESVRGNYFEKYDRRFALTLDRETLDERPDDALVEELGDGIYDRRFTETPVPATPRAESGGSSLTRSNMASGPV
jgi:hypothetical protein